MAKLANVLQAVAGSGGGDSYWVAEFVDTNPTTSNREDIRFYDVAIDSSDNVYLAGTWNNKYYQTSARSILALKLDADGILQWDNHWYGSADSNFASVEVNSNDEPIYGYETNSNSAGYDDFVASKLNSSTGAITWSRQVGTNTPDSMDDSKQIAIDSNDNIFLSGEYGTSTTYCWGVRILDNGSFSSQRRMNFGTNMQNYGIHINKNNDYIYFLGNDFRNSYRRGSIIVKQAASSSVWNDVHANDYYINNQFGQLRAADNDSSNNVYLVGEHGLKAHIHKINNVGTKQWDNIFNFSSTSHQTKGVKLQSTGDVIVGGTYYDSTLGGYQGYIASFASSDGSFNWAVKIERSSSTENSVYSVALDSNDNIVFCGVFNVSGIRRSYATKIASDGSTTGTFGDYTFTSLSAPTQTTGLFPSAQSPSTSSPGETSTAPTWTEKQNDPYFDDTTTDL